MDEIKKEFQNNVKSLNFEKGLKVAETIREEGMLDTYTGPNH